MSAAGDLAMLAVKLYAHALTKPACGYQPGVGLATHDAQKLTSLARSYQRLQVEACNRELSPREKSRERNLEREITRECTAIGLKVTFSGDPRGYVVKLHFPDEESNGWGQDGWGIG